MKERVYQGAALDIGNDAAAYPAISDYAIIGDCRTAALISISGAVEWFCLPSFSSPSVFAAILDRGRGGAFTLRPRHAFESRRRYLGDTAILETTFITATGSVRLLDFMSIANGDDRWTAEIKPQRELTRILEGLEGTVDLVSVIGPRPNYGRGTSKITRRPGFGYVVEHDNSLMTINTDWQVVPDQNQGELSLHVTMSSGEIRTIGLGYSEREIAIRPAIGNAAKDRFQTTKAWWEKWASHCSYSGDRRPLVIRSAITLKLLTYALSGAVVAAATTSLPETIGGGRNWDYRFCWLRDASITIGAFLDLGYQDEAGAFLGWLLHSTRLTRPELRIFYDLHGRNDAREQTLEHLVGYRGSRPVRVGNAAGSQLQLDTYGSVILAAFDYMEREGTLLGGELKLLRDFGEVVCKRWEEPDHGMWEIRGEPRHFTATKLMCWAALDRLIRLGERGAVHIPLERFRENRDKLSSAIEDRGFSERHQSYVAELDGSNDGVADASLFLMGWAGYGDPRSDRLVSTLRWLSNELGRAGLYARYPTGYDGDSSQEGTFSIASAWASDLMARQGDFEGANRALDSLSATANDVGLFAEEFDPETDTALGNFPQAFSHAGFIAATLALERARETARTDVR